jgi:pantothenate kinase
MESIFAPKNISIHKYDEIASLVNGMQFVLHYAKNPSYTVVTGPDSLPEKQFTADPEGKNIGDKPVILVSIGSGVSIIKVSAFDSFERVSGTMIGGGTLIGLSNLLTGHKDFD